MACCIRRLFVSWCVLAALTFSPAAPAQRASGTPIDYPSKPVHLVVPYAAGAAPDVVARVLAEALGRSLGQPIVIDNRGGAGGMIGTNAVAKAPADGYTMLLQAAGYASYQFFYKNLPYDPERDLIPVTMVARAVGFALVVSSTLDVHSVSELVAKAKANPERITFGTAGIGSPMHLAGELFAQTAGVKLTPVHYPGVPPALTDIIGGRVNLGFPNAASALPLIRSGHLRALAITAGQRWDGLPDTPTLDEAGIPGFRFVGWYGLWFPRGTPAGIVDRIQSEVAQAMRDPELRRRLKEQGLEAIGSTQAEFAKAIREETDLNRRLAAQIGIVPQ